MRRKRGSTLFRYRNSKHEYNRILRKVIALSIDILLSPITVPYSIYLVRKWNGGICKKCKSDKYTLTDYDSDRIFQNTYTCDKCGYECRSFVEFNELSKEESIQKVRDYKLKGILNE